MESLLGILALGLMGLGVVGWLWITVMAFSEGEMLWGIGCLIISPLCIVYGLMNYHEAKIPLLMVCGAMICRLGLGVFVLATT